MSQLVERNLTNKPRELGDMLAYANAKDAPLLTKLRTHPKLVGMQFESNVRLYRKGDRTPVTEGADVSTFNSNTGQTIMNTAQIFQDAVSVSQVAAAVHTATEKADGGQIDRQLEESAVAMTRMVEGACFSNQEASVEDGASARWQIRGLFNLSQSGAQTNYPINASFRPSAGQRYTGTAAAFGETAWKAQAAALFSAIDGQVSELDGYVGITIKQAFDMFTNTTTISSTLAATARYNRPDATKYIATVDQVTISGLKVNLLPTNRLLTNTDGSASASTPLAGIFIDPQMFSLGYVKDASSRQLADTGGGEKWLTEAIAMLICDNPLGTVSIIAT